MKYHFWDGNTVRTSSRSSLLKKKNRPTYPNFWVQNHVEQLINLVWPKALCRCILWMLLYSVYGLTPKPGLIPSYLSSPEAAGGICKVWYSGPFQVMWSWSGPVINPLTQGLTQTLQVREICIFSFLTPCAQCVVCILYNMDIILPTLD